MAKSEHINDPASEEGQFWLKTRNEFLAGLSERIRTMSLGALVLIWGLLVGEHRMVGQSNKHSKIALLTIALCSVVVLTLDFLEYACGYQAGRQRLGEDVRPNIDYEGVRQRVLLSKQILAALTLFAFILILGGILCNEVVNAGGQDEQLKNYYGRWCVADPNTGKFSVLIIGNNVGQEFVQYNALHCTDLMARVGYIVFVCGQYHYAVAREGASLNMSVWKGQWSNGHHETRQLFNCKH